MVRNANVIGRLIGKGKADEASNKGLLLSLARIMGVRKDSLQAIVRSVLVILSLASAHYCGFMTRVPFEMVSIVAVDFLSAFISVFIFYFIMSYTISRVFAFSISQLVISGFHAFAAFVLLLRRKWPGRFNRSGSKVYKDTLRFESVIYYVFLIFGLCLLFNLSYLKIRYSEVNEGVWYFGGGIFVALFLKAGFLARHPAKVISRLRDKKRVASRRQVFKAFLYFSTGLSLAFSYYIGVVRFDKIMGEEAVYIDSEVYSGSAIMLMKSGESFLLVNNSGGIKEFYYVADGFSVKLEGKKKKEEKPVETVAPKW